MFPSENANAKNRTGWHPFAPENSMKRMGIICCGVLTLVLLAVPLLAQQSPAAASPAALSASASPLEAVPAVTEKLNQLEKKVADAQSSADNAWMLTSAALVLLMT